MGQELTAVAVQLDPLPPLPRGVSRRWRGAPAAAAGRRAGEATAPLTPSPRPGRRSCGRTCRRRPPGIPAAGGEQPGDPADGLALPAGSAWRSGGFRRRRRQNRRPERRGVATAAQGRPQ